MEKNDKSVQNPQECSFYCSSCIKHRMQLFAEEVGRLRRQKDYPEVIRLVSSRTEPIYKRQDNHKESPCPCRDPECPSSLCQRILLGLDSPLWNPERVFGILAHQRPESNPKDVIQKCSKKTQCDLIPELRLQDSENEEEEEIECQICKTISRRMFLEAQNRTPPAPTPHNFYKHEDLRYYEGAHSLRTPTNKRPAPTPRYICKHEDLNHYESAKSSRTLTNKPPIPTPHDNKREDLQYYENAKSSRTLTNKPPVPTPHCINKREDLNHYESLKSSRTLTNKPPVPTQHDNKREDLKHYENAKSSRTLTNKPPVPTPHCINKREDLKHYEGAKPLRTLTNKPPVPAPHDNKREDLKHYENAKSSRTLTNKPPVPTPQNMREDLTHYEGAKPSRTSKNKPPVPTPHNNKREDLKPYEGAKPSRTSKNKPTVPTPQNILENGDQKNREDLEDRGKPSTKSSKLKTGLRSGEELKATVLLQIKEQEALEKIKLKSVAKKAESKPSGLPTVEKTIPKTTDRDVQKNKCDKPGKSMPKKPRPGKMDFRISAEDIARTTIYNPMTRRFQHLFLNVRERALTLMEELHKIPTQIDEIHRNAAAAKRK
ncbi:flocculation protein FLO11-like isoform X1 [Drosophila subpulchrella]|uniref:flocculation protein FLO11-like isoform X1 n=2 Tax=Drosophila subpulchrella TaxID=1486046 RepID=UPI0018A19354|nr:flocculation protein FLO11-like isoform X1 [Drosophila subpulchrella]XP_037725498.1 flocculation protein FLO11-like isoform X1 [Drosophila subpulchrella]